MEKIDRILTAASNYIQVILLPLHINMLQAVEIHLGIWLTTPVPGLITDTVNKSWILLTSWWHWSSSPIALLQMVLYTYMNNRFHQKQGSVNVALDLHVFAHILQISVVFKNIFCNTLQPTIFVNFVVRKLLCWWYMYVSMYVRIYVSMYVFLYICTLIH